MEVQGEKKEATELPQGNSTVQNSNPEIVKLESVVAETKKDLAQETAAQVKGKRGPKPKPRDANGNIIRGNQAETSSMSSQVGPEVAATASMPAAAPEVDIKPILKTALQVPFSIWATKTNVKELELSDEEAEGPAQCANQLVNLYMPDLQKQDPKKVLAWSFALSMGMIVAQKMQILATKKEQMAVQNSQSTIKQAPHNSPVSPVAGPPAETQAPIIKPGDQQGGSFFPSRRDFQI